MEQSLHKGLHKVKCRECKKEVNYQGYKEHLKTQHPEENPGDMQDFNQPTLFGGLKRKKVGEDKEKIKEEMDEEEKQGEEKEEEEEIENYWKQGRPLDPALLQHQVLLRLRSS